MNDLLVYLPEQEGNGHDRRRKAMAEERYGCVGKVRFRTKEHQDRAICGVFGDLPGVVGRSVRRVRFEDGRVFRHGIRRFLDHSLEFEWLLPIENGFMIDLIMKC